MRSVLACVSMAIVASFFLIGPVRAATSVDTATYVYYPNGRLESITYANGTVITYTYDQSGNRTQVVTTCSANPC